MKIRSLDGKTPDIAEENIQKLRQIFPDVFTEDKIDFEKLQQVLGECVEDSNERYNFTWNGKGRALRLSQTPSLGTLRPCKEESKDWDTTQNLYIEGDNLEVLKLLQKSYYGKVKMIYIDPPYNTGKDFVYKDDFHDSLENYKRITGQVDGNGKAISTNTETSGRYHTDWLNMIYPRIRLARNLLTDDGIIGISIDENEIDNLKKLCNEIFDEDNFIALVIHKNNSNKNQTNLIGISTEYLIVYCKNKEKLRSITWRIPKRGAEDIVKYFNKSKAEGKKLDEILIDIKEMYKKPKDLLYRIAFTYVKNRADAEDILQETFLKYFQKEPLFENKEHEKRWLIRVTINLCKNHLLSFWQQNRCDMSDQFYMDFNDEEMILLQEIMSLPAKQRGIIYLHYYEGYSCKEMAEIIGVGESAVKMRLKKGREILRKSMEV